MSDTTRKDDELRMEIIRKTSTRMSLSDVDIVMQIVKQYGVKERVEKTCIDTPNSQSSVDSKDDEQIRREILKLQSVDGRYVIGLLGVSNSYAMRALIEYIKQYGVQERIDEQMISMPAVKDVGDELLFISQEKLDGMNAITKAHINHRTKRVEELTALKDKQESKR